MAISFIRIMVTRTKKNLKLYFVNRLTKNLENKVISEKYNKFITSNLITYSKFKNYSNFYFLHDYIKNSEVRNFYLKKIRHWHSMLYEIDIKLNGELFKNRIEKNNNIFIASYTFRYFAFQEFCSLLCILKGIKRFIKKKKFHQTLQIDFLGFVNFKYFDLKFIKLFFQKNLRQNIVFKIDKKKDNFYKIKEFNYENIKNIINKKNFFIFIKLLKKQILNKLKNLTNHPCSLYLSYNKELLYEENVSYIKLNNFSFKNILKLNYKIKNIKNFKFKSIPKNFSDYIAKETIKNFNENFTKIEDLKKNFLYFKIKDVRYDVEDTKIDSLIAIHTAKLLKLDVIGYQHGSDYGGTSKRDIDHNYLSYQFCDKFKNWGQSKYFKKKKFNIYKKKINFIKNGSLLGRFSDKFFNYDINESNSKILYVPTVVRTNYTIAKSVQDPIKQYSIQKKIIDFLSKINQKDNFVSLPSYSYNFSLDYFPIVYYSKIDELKKLFGSFKNNLLKIKPKTLLFDNYSTPVYEALSTKCNIIVIMDQLNLPSKDVLNKLKKRAYLINDLSNLEDRLAYFIKQKSKTNNGFKNSFYL